MKGTRGNSLKARSVSVSTSVCLSKEEVQVQVLQDWAGAEEGGRHSSNCTTSVLVGKSLLSNGHPVWHRSFTSAKLQLRGGRSFCLCMCGLSAGEPVCLRSDLCWVFCRVPGKFTPVESAALTVPWDKVAPQHRSRASRRQKDGCEKLWVVWILSRKCSRCYFCDCGVFWKTGLLYFVSSLR